MVSVVQTLERVYARDSMKTRLVSAQVMRLDFATVGQDAT